MCLRPQLPLYFDKDAHPCWTTALIVNAIVATKMCQRRA
jgi:hypothetical protein